MTMRWLAAAILACVVLAGCQREAPDPDDPPTTPAPVADAPAGGEDGAVDDGAPAVPSLRVETLDGDQYDLADHRGKWVVVNFWATWCAPCREEMPELSALGVMREHVEVIGLAYEEIEPEAMRAFLEEHPVAYPIAIVDVYDPPADFDTPRGLPMTYLIGPDGTVARQFLGPISAHDIETAIAEAGGPPLPDDAEEPAA
ncbi:MAG: TlpA family protein disulfide reductase [Luteimonas sp.]